MMDVSVKNEGTIWLFRPITDKAVEWREENVGEHQDWCGALVCEHRYAPDLAAGMQDSGLILGEDHE